MSRPSPGGVVANDRDHGRVFALRFRAYGKRRYLTLGSDAEGWTLKRAETELANVLADVRRGIWQPPVVAQVAPAEPEPVPTFHQFASEWLDARRHELRPRTVDDYEWALTHHLIPWFRSFPVDQITLVDVDKYRAAKVRDREQQLVDRPLSNRSINKTLVRLSQVLELAVEYGLIDRNPAAGKRRRLKADPPRSAWLETDQVAPLLDAAGTKNRAILATAILAGLRAGELCALRWGDVNLARGTIAVRASKTDAGVRTVDMTASLRDELATHKARAEHAGAADLVFLTGARTPQNRHNLLRRVLKPAVKRANERLVKEERDPINERLTTHSLRHSFASLLFEAGESVPYVMAQLGHSDPAVTLRIYAHVLKRQGDVDGRMAKRDALIHTPQVSEQSMRAIG